MITPVKNMVAGIAGLAVATNLFAAEPLKVKSIADYIGQRGTVEEYASLTLRGKPKYQGNYKDFTVMGKSGLPINVRVWAVNINGIEHLVDEIKTIDPRTNKTVTTQLIEDAPYDGILDYAGIDNADIYLGKGDLARLISAYQTAHDINVNQIYEQTISK